MTVSAHETAIAVGERRAAGARKGLGLAARAVMWTYIAAISLFLVVPVAIVVIVSFDTAAYIRFPPTGLTTRWYAHVLSSSSLMTALRNSVVVGFGCTLLALAVGVPAAIAIARREFPGKSFIYALILSPLTVPWIVIGLGLLFMWVAFDLPRSNWTLVVGHAVVGLPYVVRTCVAVLHGVPETYELAARTLGATPWRAFRLVTLPMMRMGILAGATFCMLISFINVPVPLFVTTSSNLTIPVAIFSYMQSNLDPGVAAVSTIQLVLILLAFWIAQRVARLGDFLY